MKVEIICTRAREEVYGVQDRDADQEDLRWECLDGTSIIIGDPRDEEYRAIERTQSNHDCSSVSMYISSQPVMDSGTFLIREIQTQRCTKFNSPPVSRADIFEVGRESVSGSISTWNMISDGKLAALYLHSARRHMCGW